MKKIFFSKFSKKDILGYILLIIGAICGLTIIKFMAFDGKYNLMLMGLIIIWLLNIIFCFLDIKKRIITFLFHMMLLLFLISRILIPAIQGGEWWKNFSIHANIFGVTVISYSMIAIVAGTVIAEICNKVFVNSPEKKSTKKIVNLRVLMLVVRIILVVCMVCFFLVEFDKVLFMRGRVYEDYFSSYQSRMPFFVTIPAGCMSFVLFMLLALKPTKKESFFWLVLYVMSAVPMLKIGIRNAFILNCVFAFVYYFLRDGIREKNEEKWIGKFEKTILICAIPTMILFSGAYNYIRDGKAVKLSPVSLAVDFAFKQGTTYDTVLQGYQNKDKLIWKEQQKYTLGAVTDAFYYNSLGKKIFDLEDIGSGNGLKMVYNGHTFSHAISYVVLGKNYIAGEGRGSSYIIENYVDWGYPGVIGFSVLLGVICSLISSLFGKKWLISIIVLLSLILI